MFRFTIRDVLWLTVVVAMAVGWWVQLRKAEAAIQVAKEAQENARVAGLIARDDANRHSEEMRVFRRYVELLTAKLEEKGYRPRFRVMRSNQKLIMFEAGERPPEE